MQFRVTDDAAVKFSSALYSAIAKTVPLDIAVTNGRIGMAAQNSFEWITPILYIANPDASLFSIPPAAPAKYRQKTHFRRWRSDVRSAGANWQLMLDWRY